MERDIGRVFRAEYGRAVAVPTRLIGDVDIADEAIQDAFTTAVQKWPSDGAGGYVTGRAHVAVTRWAHDT